MHTSKIWIKYNIYKVTTLALSTKKIADTNAGNSERRLSLTITYVTE